MYEKNVREYETDEIRCDNYTKWFLSLILFLHHISFMSVFECWWVVNENSEEEKKLLTINVMTNKIYIMIE